MTLFREAVIYFWAFILRYVSVHSWWLRYARHYGAYHRCYLASLTQKQTYVQSENLRWTHLKQLENTKQLTLWGIVGFSRRGKSAGLRVIMEKPSGRWDWSWALKNWCVGKLTLQTEEKYEIIRLEINRIIWGSSNMPLPCEVDGLSRMVRGNRWDGTVCETEKMWIHQHVMGPFMNSF